MRRRRHLLLRALSPRRLTVRREDVPGPRSAEDKAPGETGQARMPVVSLLQGPWASAVPSGRSVGVRPAGAAPRHPTPCPQPRASDRGSVRTGRVGAGRRLCVLHRQPPGEASYSFWISVCVFIFFLYKGENPAFENGVTARVAAPPPRLQPGSLFLPRRRHAHQPCGDRGLGSPE